MGKSMMRSETSPYLSAFLTAEILRATGAKEIGTVSLVQALWSDMGHLLRVNLKGSADDDTVIVKHVAYGRHGHHPRGWNTDVSLKRKVKSYQVENHWYREFAHRCPEDFCRVPRFIAESNDAEHSTLILEDLNEVGFPLRQQSLSEQDLKNCLSWLAHFHGTFLETNPKNLWPVGTYWHLDTRPDEWASMEKGQLKNKASQIDAILNEARFQTIVHGDAKVANFCFSDSGKHVAALDFQYVGRGCGMKDVAYFLSSCLNESECEQRESELLDFYFSILRDVLRNKNFEEIESLEKEWRDLYPIAWTDFFRFLQGWMPGHWKINSYSRRLAMEVLAGK
jgi:hypothetical protein